MSPNTLALLALAPLTLICVGLFIYGQRKRKRVKQRARASYNHQDTVAQFVEWLHKLHNNRNLFAEDIYILCVKYGESLKNITGLAEFKMYVSDREDRARLIAAFQQHRTGINRVLTDKEQRHLLGD